MADKKRKEKEAWATCDDWGGYMNAKKAKLEEQFAERARDEFSNPTNLFQGISIFVNGYTNPVADELKRLMMAHGGTYHHYLRHSTTHLIASNLPYSKIVAYRKAAKPIPLCKPEWITDSIKAGKVLDYRYYLLYAQTSNQPAILSHFLKQTKPESDADKVLKSNQTCAANPQNLFNPNIESIYCKEKDSNSKIQAEVINISNHTNEKPSTITSGEYKENNLLASSKYVEKTNSNQAVQKANMGSSTANLMSSKNPEFLTEFYQNSRLHHIATMGAIFKDYINELRDKSDGKFPGLDALKKKPQLVPCKPGPSTRLDGFDSDDDLFDDVYDDINPVSRPVSPILSRNKQSKIIMHIDMDCFFVSVGLRNHPELRGFPIAVAHSKGNNPSTSKSDDFGSMSEIASCSYEARQAGVKNGMFLGQALKLCPNLKTIQYDFEGYKEVSYCLYDTVASYTLDIEAVSCDEMYVDCTKILEASKSSPLDFATVIRNEINKKTGCPVSTGFGENKLQARLATKKAKPNGQFYFQGNSAINFIRTLNVKDLPGVGYSTSRKLKQLNVSTCADLQSISLYNLQKEFGKKTGQQLYNMCRGIDDTKLNLEHIRKSISAEANYGIRFKDNQEAHEFLKKLSEEISDRLKKIDMKGRCLTLKVMFRSKDAPNEPRKFMGHGVCDAFNKSKNLICASDDPILIAREVINLWNQFNEKPEDARGIGIQMTKLESAKFKSTESNLLKFINRIPTTKNVNESKNVKNATEKQVNEIREENHKNFVNNKDCPRICEGKIENAMDKQLDDEYEQNYDENINISKTCQEKIRNYFDSMNGVVFDEVNGDLDNNFEDLHNNFEELDNKSEGFDNNFEDLDSNFENLEDNEDPLSLEDNLTEQFQMEVQNMNLREKNTVTSALVKDFNQPKNEPCKKSPVKKNPKNSSQMRQPIQQDYFKVVKPSSSKVNKFKIPDFNEIDMNVLVELPEDIRNEILNDYKRNQQGVPEPINVPSNPNSDNQNNHNIINRLNEEKAVQKTCETKSNPSGTNEKTMENISFSQIDPEFLAAIPDDMKKEVRSYLDAQKKQKNDNEEKKVPNSRSNKGGWDMFKNDKGTSKKSTKAGKSKTIGIENEKKTKSKFLIPDCELREMEEERIRNLPKLKFVEEPPKPSTPDSNQTVYFEESEENPEHAEILNQLVKNLLDTPLNKIKSHLQQWITKHSEVNPVDFLSIETYLSTLPRKKRIEDLYTITKYMYRLVVQTENCLWHDAYRKIIKEIQIQMRLQYRYDLSIQEIKCEMCKSEL